ALCKPSRQPQVNADVPLALVSLSVSWPKVVQWIPSTLPCSNRVGDTVPLTLVTNVSTEELYSTRDTSKESFTTPVLTMVSPAYIHLVPAICINAFCALHTAAAVI